MHTAEIITGCCLGGLALAGVATAWSRHRRHRDRLYAELARERETLHSRCRIALSDAERATALAQPFTQDHFVMLPDFTSAATFTALRDEALQLLPTAVRTYLPGHKKGGAVSYEALQRSAPHCVAFFFHHEVQRVVSEITGHVVYPTPDQDQSSLSLLCYTEPGDHINWHFDHNFYRGHHYTVLLPLINTGQGGGASQSRYERRVHGHVLSQETPPNCLIVFEGARVLHRATPTVAGDCRVILSMTYCTDPGISRVKELARRIKDTAFFGIRALWD